MRSSLAMPNLSKITTVLTSTTIPKMESEIWLEYGYNESVNRRTIDQTVVSPDITTLLKQKK
jgi:hypothetical protein